MRRAFCEAMVARAPTPSLVFLTGDLGFLALEPLQAALEGRFINAGVAEQNMIGVAAGLAREGCEAWAYSIAPFCYARPFEQIRNDVSFHGLAVKLVGNGGGFGYGVQGPTHHALEDYGVLLTLQDLRVFLPAFDSDVAAIVPKLGALRGPGYLRLGLDEAPADAARPAYAGWRQLLEGEGWTVVAVGPLAGAFLPTLQALPRSHRPSLWVLTELPLATNPIPEALLAQLARSAGLCVVEEHVAQGGAGAAMALDLALRGRVPARFRHLCAARQVYPTYGSQRHLRRQAAIDVEALLAVVSEGDGGADAGR